MHVGGGHTRRRISRRRKCLACLLPTRRRSVALCCLPLGAVSVLISFGFLAWGVASLQAISKSYPDPRDDFWNRVDNLLMGLFKLVTGILGIVLVTMFQKPGGAHLLYVACVVCIVSTSVKFASRWLEWISALTGNSSVMEGTWHPTASDICVMVWFTVRWFLFVFITFSWGLSVLGSLERVLLVGGTGWEWLRYDQIVTVGVTVGVCHHDEVRNCSERATADQQLHQALECQQQLHEDLRVG
eukprot:Lankesteria_metandrocarpae@DN1301_c0_g1_i1.p1